MNALVLLNTQKELREKEINARLVEHFIFFYQRVNKFYNTAA